MKPEPRIAINIMTDEGDNIEFTPSSIKPLTYEDLISENKRYKMQFSVKNGNLKINGEVSEKNTKNGINIQFDEEVVIYVLELGGWLPLNFVNYNSILPDRNIISSIKQIKNNKLAGNKKAIDWWLKLSKESDFTINPLLYAFEGQYQRPPNFTEFCKSFNEASEELQEFFPKAQIISYPNEETYRKAFDLLIEISEQNTAEREFLVNAVPFILQRVSDKKLNDTKRTIDGLAEKYGILIRKPFVYYLVVSCLYDDPKDGSGYLPARKLLKPRKNYTEKDAYNAISDINAITFFIQSLSLPDLMMPVCTCDKALAAFWAAINPFKRTVQNKTINIEFQFPKYLFPRLTAEEQKDSVSCFNNLGSG